MKPRGIQPSPKAKSTIREMMWMLKDLEENDNSRAEVLHVMNHLEEKIATVRDHI